MTWLATTNLMVFFSSMKDQIQNGKQLFSRVSHIYLRVGDFMLLEPVTCWMLHTLQLPNGENLIWRRAQSSIFLGLVTTYGVIRMNFNRLPRHPFIKRKKRKRQKQRVSADKQFRRLIVSLDPILNTSKILFVMSNIYLNENSQTKISFLIFIKLCFKSCDTHFFFLTT